MTREETTERLKMILAEATSHEDAVCYVTSNDADALEIAIKALEQEQNIHDKCKRCVEFSEFEQKPCEDAISRQAVEDAIARTIVNGEELGYLVADDILYDLPSVTPQQRWIPVSERLPEEHKDVLTCGLGGFIEIQSFENAYDGYWENQNGAWSDLDEVAAWMPLPPSYQGEENG